MLKTARSSATESSQNRLFLTIEYLLLHFLKTELRKQVTPQLVQVKCDQSNGKITMRDTQMQEVTLDQYILKSSRGELVLIETDMNSNTIKNAYFVKLASQSQRISFAIYKERAEMRNIRSELDCLVENILANTRNNALVHKISRCFDTALKNHLQGSTGDDYDEDLLSPDMKVHEMTVEENERATLIPNSEKKPQKTMELPKPENGEARASSTGERAPQQQAESTYELHSIDPTAHLQQQTEKLSRIVEVVHPEEDANNYGIKPGSVKPEVFSSYKKKLTELLNNVYLGDNSWTLVEETGGMKYWTKDDPAYVIQRSEITLDHPLEIVKDYVCDPDFRFKYDTLIKKFEILEKLSDQVALIHVVMKGSFPVSDRDFVTCRASFYQNKDVVNFNLDFHLHELRP